MTAPGNSALLVTLLAVFVACSAYAAGRLHQRYQMERDREEAYRDGYDTATRSVFSLAARVIAPRRAVRASVPALPTGSGRPGDSATRPGPEPAGDPAAPATPPGPASGAAAPGSPDGVVSGTAMPGEGSTPHPVPGYPGLLRRAAVPGTNPKPVPEPNGPESLGFPAPPPPPPRVVAEAAAVGGVVYQPFPDPRLLADAPTEPTGHAPAPRRLGNVPAGPTAPTGPAPTPVRLGDAPTDPSGHAPTPVRTALHYSAGVPQSLADLDPAVPSRGGRPRAGRGPASSPGVPPADAEPTAAPEASSGRHTVPDELVQATTYRLPPDRIFRARVPDSTLPDEPTTRLSAPSASAPAAPSASAPAAPSASAPAAPSASAPAAPAASAPSAPSVPKPRRH
ncbi:hypothetical protein [Paractinoplanes rishiriensis]|uniref:Uncharacterized protein n=1 Tax=Paractinoplanes rishiriensis TaxID=1050105 RepID=A0A919MMP9_9ACTN|nr:hypothetical protein [Actinoplanes rishiriensis]GIE93186.1 hypothetical protein Ari01nite_06510 [Actinoplanes rishiriensis]